MSCACLIVLLLSAQAAGAPRERTPVPTFDASAFRTLTLQTSEVTRPSLAVTPDGRSVIFSLLGHLFQVSTTGGLATQLTFGFSYDSEPAVSPDGQRVAFVSDRDGSGGNVFVLEFANRNITQLTHELQVGRPAWSPDGRTIAYLRHLPREDHPLEMIGFGGATLMELWTVPSRGGKPTMVAGPGEFGAAFYLPDGRLAWTLAEPSQDGGMLSAVRTVRIEARAPEGQISLLGTIKDDLAHTVLAPTGDGIYYSTSSSLRSYRFAAERPSDLASLTDGAARLAVTRDSSGLIYGDRGCVWRMTLPGGRPERVPFDASVTLVVRRQAEPRWAPPTSSSAPPRAIVGPQLSPDQRTLVFMAAGFLYQQPLDGQDAHRLFEGVGFERDPAFSPDGSKLAFVVSEFGKRHLRVYDFATRATRTLYTVGGASWPLTPSWSPDGTRIVFQRSDTLSEPYRIISVHLVDGKNEVLTELDGAWTARPHFAADGRSIYYTARREKIAALYRLSLQPNAKPVVVTDLTRHLNDALVSPNGKWLAFRRNTEIWLAPMDAAPVRDTHLRRIATDCSRSFSFTPDSSAILYASAHRVWRQPVTAGKRSEIPVRLMLRRPTPAPLLVRGARLLDLDSGRFGEPTSLLIQDHRIAWTGSESSHEVPARAVVLDASGRYAVPGLSDVHAHAAWANHQTDPDAFIGFGVTSVRDVGGSLDVLSAFRDRGDRTNLPVPRFVSSGEIFEGAMPMWGDAFLQIASEEEARFSVRKWKEWGADFIKVYPSLPWHLQAVVADEAQRQSLPLVGHAISFEEMVRHVVQGYASVEHTTGVMNEDGRKLMAAAGTRWIATLTCEGGSELFMHEEPARLSTDLVRAYVPPDKLRSALAGGRLSFLPKELQRANMQSSLARVFAAYREGVRLRAGTDALMTEVFFGLSLHWELEFLTQGGLSPVQALRMGTQDAAETVGAGDHLGTLAPGRLADILLLESNPLENIQNTLRIWRVIKGGDLFDPKALHPAQVSGGETRDSGAAAERAPSPVAEPVPRPAPAPSPAPALPMPSPVPKPQGPSTPSNAPRPTAAESGKPGCLKCHGLFDKLRERTGNRVAPSGETVNPHRQIPHRATAKETPAVPECETCHVKHDLPRPAKGALVEKPKWDLCFNECHHIKDFTPCATCHPKYNAQ